MTDKMVVHQKLCGLADQLRTIAKDIEDLVDADYMQHEPPKPCEHEWVYMYPGEYQVCRGEYRICRKCGALEQEKLYTGDMTISVDSTTYYPIRSDEFNELCKKFGYKLPQDTRWFVWL